MKIQVIFKILTMHGTIYMTYYLRYQEPYGLVFCTKEGV